MKQIGDSLPAVVAQEDLPVRRRKKFRVQRTPGGPFVFTKYDNKAAMQVVNAIAEGYSLRTIATMKGYPSRATIWRWQTQNPNFATMMEAAERYRLEKYADELVDIADETGDADRRIKTRQWLLERLLREKFSDPATPVPQVVNRQDDNMKVIDGSLVDEHPLARSLAAWEEAAQGQTTDES